MNMGSDQPQKEGLLLDASNRFFTLIPSVQPNVINSVKMLKTKVRDIERMSVTDNLLHLVLGCNQLLYLYTDLFVLDAGSLNVQL